MIKVAIAGGTGYTAGELMRILVNHPYTELVAVLSSSVPGLKVSSVHKDLEGDTDLVFSENLGSGNNKIIPDVLFLTMGHGVSRDYMKKMDIPHSCRIIDLAGDFRIEGDYDDRNFVYGLSELNKNKIKEAGNVANPGCFATAILLAILPLAQHNLISDDIHIHAITGSTGAGKSLSETSHFSYRDSNISAYKPFTHQHLGEIRNALMQYFKDVPQINFIPLRGDFTRGIFASVYTKADNNFDINDINKFYRDYYEASPFVFLREEAISMKEVVNTNKAFLHIGYHNGYWHITSAIDNLLKGASGQAVQNMNLMMGLQENCGLKLKANAF